jgi:hypothetical protein
MILNHQKKIADYEKTNERGVVIHFGSNFCQKRQAPKKIMRRSSGKLFFLTTADRDPLKLYMNFKCLRPP